jgi:hypothetical protein
MNWPWRRFDAFYEAFVKRRSKEELTFRKILQISALWANSNYDGEEVDRQQIIRDIETSYDEVIAEIYSGRSAGGRTDIDKSDPFFAAMERGMKKQGIAAPHGNKEAND